MNAAHLKSKKTFFAANKTKTLSDLILRSEKKNKKKTENAYKAAFVLCLPIFAFRVCCERLMNI